LKDKWEKIGLKLEDEWEGVDIEKVLQEGPSPQGCRLCAIEAYTLAKQDMEVLKDKEKTESMMSNLDNMWCTEDKESNIQDFDDEDCDDHEDFKEEMNAYIAKGLHVPQDEMKEMPKGNKETPLLIEIDFLSTLQDEPKITFVEKPLRLSYTLKSQDIIGIDEDIFRNQ
jgi:hypothetical protein